MTVIRSVIRTFAGIGGVPLVGEGWDGGGGAMPVVVLLHGAGQTRHSWRRTGPQLAARGLCAMALDMRGHGDSGWARDGDYCLTTLAGDVISVQEQIGSPVIVVGSSIGGLTGIHVAARLGPQAVHGLVLVDVVPRFETAGSDRIRRFMTHNRHGFETLEEVRDAVASYAPGGRPGDHSVEGLRRLVRRDAGRWYWHWDPVFADRPEEESQYGRGRLEGLAAGLTIPLLAIRGALSDVVSGDSLAEFRRVVPAAVLVELPGVGHAVLDDENRAFEAAIVEFVTKHLR